MVKKELKYIAGTFLVKADAAFINGAGLQMGEDQNVSVPKTMWKNGQKIPYVSSQAWKHMLRQTIVDEFGWPASNLRAIGWNDKGNTSKIAGMLNPIQFPEDDFFGYMYALSESKSKTDLLPKEPSEEQTALVDTLPDVQLVRPSRILASLLYAIQNDNTISTDNAFVHLKDDTPLPYSTKFYNADLQAMLGIDYDNIGVFDNLDALELNPALADIASQDGTIKQIAPDSGQKISTEKIKDLIISKIKYECSDVSEYRKQKVSEFLKGLAILRGGFKETQFGTDIAPKALILAGLNCKNPFLNNLFKCQNGETKIHIDLLKELIKDYKDRIMTKVYIGIRKDYLANEAEIIALNDTEIEGISIYLGTPIEITEKMGDEL